MQVSEILEHTREELDDKSDLIAGAPDDLWSDELLVRFLSQGEQRLARFAWVLVDDTSPACCEVALSADQATYNLHKSVLRVLSARLSDTDIDLTRTDHYFIRPYVGVPEPELFQPSYQYTEPSSRPRLYSTDNAVRVIRFRPAPNADAAALSALLRVVRLPLKPLSLDQVDCCPEVPEEYHLELVDWAVYRALMLPNVDTQARQTAKDYRDRFEASLREAKRDRWRQEYAPPQFVFGGWAN